MRMKGHIMAETTLQPDLTGGAAPAVGRRASPLARLWMRLSPRLVPVFAVLTALLLTIPLMIVTSARGDVGRGLAIAGTAFSALIEGSTGIVINDIVSRDDFNEVLALAASGPLEVRDLRDLQRGLGVLVSAGVENIRRFAEARAQFAAVPDEALADLVTFLPEVARLNAALAPQTLADFAPVIGELEGQSRPEVRALAADFAPLDALTAEQRARLAALAPATADYDDAALLAFMRILNEEGIVRLARALSAEQAAGGEVDPEALSALAGALALDGGLNALRLASAALARMDAARLTDPEVLLNEVTYVRNLYQLNLLTGDDVVAALNDQLDDVTGRTTLVRRPGGRMLSTSDIGLVGRFMDARSTPDDPSDDVVEALYLRLGGSALLFFPANLETMLVRAIPFIIAGLAVALGFKAGLFNIGAEGQLYAGGILAVWVGFSPIFAGLPAFIHVPLMIVAGILGGFLWGAIPGALKAFTGAHEVIVTIMLNYTAIRLVDWLIKSTDPIILLDPAASTPRTPYILPTAILPRFNLLGTPVILAAGAVVLLIGLWSARHRLRSDLRAALRPLLLAAVTVIGGLFLTFINTRGLLHLGFIIMLAAVWFTDWFLNRTTPGFELRTVGANPNAARYAGMSVRRTIIMAMAISGGLAGLAGVVEISGVQNNMQPEFFSGLGFDAIAVALLARTNPRSMIPAGLLWGSLLAGAGLMQVRANISIDLVKIIQALIIMFIAADAIIRFIYRVPKTEKTALTTFSKGWGS
jgi:simple sugar transport system permease protein